MKKIVVILLLVSVVNLVASHISYDSEAEKFKIHNKQNGKIINYYRLDPGEVLELRAVDITNFKLITRIVFTDDTSGTYTYEIKYDGYFKKIRKTARFSDISRALDGSYVSSYNSVALNLDDYSTEISIKNSSREILLVKASGENSVNSSPDIEYVHYSPDSYEEEKNLQIRDKIFSYYCGKNGAIELNLTGPIFLKIVSRLITDSSDDEGQNYHYKIASNGNVITGFTESATSSKVARLENDSTKVPSQGDINILKLEPGNHRITINSLDQDLIFRFYISKSSIRINR